MIAVAFLQIKKYLIQGFIFMPFNFNTGFYVYHIQKCELFLFPVCCEIPWVQRNSDSDK